MAEESLGERTEARANEVLANSKDKDALKMAEALLYVLPYYRKYVREHGELTTELETLRSERDALKAAVGTTLETLNDAKILIENGERTEDNWDYPEYTELRNRVLDRITWHNQDAALNTPAAPPAAEWTPREGERVWVNDESFAGKVVKIAEASDVPYAVELRPGRIHDWYAREELSRHDFD